MLQAQRPLRTFVGNEPGADLCDVVRCVTSCAVRGFCSPLPAAAPGQRVGEFPYAPVHLCESCPEHCLFRAAGAGACHPEDTRRSLQRPARSWATFRVGNARRCPAILTIGQHSESMACQTLVKRVRQWTGQGQGGSDGAAASCSILLRLQGAVLPGMYRQDVLPDAEPVRLPHVGIRLSNAPWPSPDRSLWEPALPGSSFIPARGLRQGLQSPDTRQVCGLCRVGRVRPDIQESP